jgi:hypothetical protein
MAPYSDFRVIFELMIVYLMCMIEIKINAAKEDLKAKQKSRFFTIWQFKMDVKNCEFSTCCSKIEVIYKRPLSNYNLRTFHCFEQMSPSTLLHYLDSNLIFLKSNLVPENFERVLAVIWATSASSLSAIIHDAIGKPIMTPQILLVHKYTVYQFMVYVRFH